MSFEENVISVLKVYNFNFQPTYLALVPPLISFLATHPMVKSSMLESVRAVTGGAAPFGPALIENFKKKCEPHDVEFREGKLFLRFYAEMNSSYCLVLS